jgi:hypothetical protein
VVAVLEGIVAHPGGIDVVAAAAVDIEAAPEGTETAAAEVDLAPGPEVANEGTPASPFGSAA